MIDARQLLVRRGYWEEAGEEGDQGTGDRGDEVVAGKEEEGSEAAKAAAEKAAEDERRAADKQERDKKVTIPKERFDEAVGKERKAREAAEKQARELQEQLASKATAADVKKLESRLDELEDSLEAKMTEGTPEERKAIRAEMRKVNEQLMDARVEARSAMATAIAIEQVKYDSLVERLESDYPFLNVDNSDDFDGELAGEVMELKAAYEAAGHGSTAALKKAVGTLQHKLDAKKAPAKKGKEDEDEGGEKDEAKKAAEAKIKAAEKAAEEAEKKRREAAVTKAQDAKGKQPPAKTSDVGKTDKTVENVKVSELDDDAFDKLPEAEKKRLRGD